jgi:YegS/Rv2252/BmrU family lipid kinase
MTISIALLAHRAQEDTLIKLVKQHTPTLKRYRLISTANLREKIRDQTSLSVKLISPKDEEGAALGYAIEQGKILAIICLIDPSASQPEFPDIQALSLFCSTHNIPLGINLATAIALINSLTQTPIAHLIFNPVAGQGNSTEELALIRQTLSPTFQLFVHLTTPEINADELVKEALLSQPDLIIASGGDGTVSVVASALIKSGIPLGIIPRGTANAFAVALGIPTTVKEACDVILADIKRAVDAAHCPQQDMILLAGIGFEAGMVEKASREMKNYLGVLAYILAGAQQLNEQGIFDIEIEVDGIKNKSFTAGAITIANAAPPTSVLAQGIGQVNPSDGLLDVTIAMPKSRLDAVTGIIEVFSAALIKSATQRDDVVHFKTPKIKVTTNPPQKVVIDGEIVGTTPIEIECIPGGLTVFVPPFIPPSYIEKLADFWITKISPSLNVLTATVGIGGLVGSAIAFWGLGKIFTYFLEKPTHIAEMEILWKIHHLSHPIWDRIMLTITFFGDVECIVPLAFIGLSVLWWKRAYQEFWTLGLACFGALILNLGMKIVIARARPQLWHHLVVETTYSFPSGHALGATVFYGAIAYFVATQYPKFSLGIYSFTTIFVILISISRLYLGVHWPSDVFAGFCIGFLWLTTCLTMLRLQKLKQQTYKRKTA